MHVDMLPPREVPLAHATLLGMHASLGYIVDGISVPLCTTPVRFLSLSLSGDLWPGHHLL